LVPQAANGRKKWTEKGRCAQIGLKFSESAAVKKDLGNAEEVMTARYFSALLKQFALLSQRQRAHLLASLPVRDSAAAVIDAVTGAQPVCPIALALSFIAAVEPTARCAARCFAGSLADSGDRPLLYQMRTAQKKPGKSRASRVSVCAQAG